MSAITGIYLLDGRPVARADLERMVETLAHRGPDGAGVWNEGSVGLGQRMLWTTPESLQERLPLANRTGELVITADARIDNRDELIAALGLGGRPREEITDSELILGAYEQWGERCPERLLGDFAFAIWDRRRQVLFCARDPLGVKPFYYHRSGRAFVFASEIKALLCLPEVPRRFNETRVADYLVPMLEDRAITFYQQILRLPPAHCLAVGREEARPWPYWSLDPSRELRLASDEEYAEAFREIFSEAVRCRLRSAYPPGSLLSGGLDSSSIVCVARQLLAGEGDGRLHTFSAIFDDLPECDERPFINAVLAQGGLEPHYVRGDRLSPLADIDRVLWHEEEVFYAANLFLNWGLYGAAQEQGVRVLLDGLHGESTVSYGIGYLAELARRGRWIALFKEASGLSRYFDRPAWWFLSRYAIKPLVGDLKSLAPEPMRRAWRALRRRDRQPSTADPIVNPVINPDFARRIGLAERRQALQGDHRKPARTERESHWRALSGGLLPLSLEVADRAAAAFSIEPRYPFLDRRLVEFCLALPGEQKLHRGWNRMIVRRALTDSLPEAVCWRTGKANFLPSLHRGLLTSDRGLLEEVILNDSNVLERYVDMAALREAYHRYRSSGEVADALPLWIATTLALWLRRTALTP